jgi:hypothetical protein
MHYVFGRLLCTLSLGHVRPETLTRGAYDLSEGFVMHGWTCEMNVTSQYCDLYVA